MIVVGLQGIGAETKAPSRSSLGQSLLDGEMDEACYIIMLQSSLFWLPSWPLRVGVVEYILVSLG